MCNARSRIIFNFKLGINYSIIKVLSNVNSSLVNLPLKYDPFLIVLRNS